MVKSQFDLGFPEMTGKFADYGTGIGLFIIFIEADSFFID